MGDAKDKEIAIHIERAISSCFEMVSELTYMKAMLMTQYGGYTLRNRFDELIDIHKKIVRELVELNDLA